MAAPSPPASGQIPDNRRLLLIALMVVVAFCVPIGLAVGMSWVDLPWSSNPSRPVPDWVGLPQVRATTADGTVVKVRVALDVPSAFSKNAIQRNTQQLGLLLEVSVASHTRAQLGSPQGIRHLSADMRTRLNDYLGASGDDAVRSVAVQDLLVKPQ
jgi:flagellar basal body-associated protein FliL